MKIILITLLCISIILDISLIVFSSTQSDRTRTAPFSLLCCALLIYTLGYTAELTSSTAEGAFAALVVENFGIPHISGLFLLTCISLFWPSIYRHWQLALASLYGMAFFLIVLTNPSHGLYYTAIEMRDVGGEFFARLERGPLYILNQVITFLFLIASYLIIAWRYVKGSRKIRHQMALFIVGSLIAFGANILNFSGLLTTGLDPTPFFLAAGLAVFSISQAREDWMDIVAKARGYALDNMKDAFIVVDRDSDFLYCNHTARELFPGLGDIRLSESIYNCRHWPKELSDPDNEQGTAFTLRDEQGYEHHYQTYIQKIYGNSRKLIGYSYIIHDDTEAADLIEELESIAATDPLTGILNRRSLFEHIQYELSFAQHCGLSTMLLMFDLDHFKTVNDTYSHQVGDIVLQQTVRSIKNQLRQSDLFGRIGGEEFLIFSQISDSQAMLHFAERLRKTIEHLEIVTECGPLHVTASFGITEICPGATLTDAMKHVDTALYKAKNSGRNCVFIGERTIPYPDLRIVEHAANKKTIEN